MSDKIVKHDGSGGGQMVTLVKGGVIGAVGTVAVITIGLVPSLILGGGFIVWRVIKKK